MPHEVSQFSNEQNDIALNSRNTNYPQGRIEGVMSYTKGKAKAEQWGDPEKDPRWIISLDNEIRFQTVGGDDKDNAFEFLRRWNAFDDLLEAAQGGLIVINELLNHVQPVLKLAGLKPIPAPPTNGIRKAIINAGGQVYENAKKAQNVLAEAEREK